MIKLPNRICCTEASRETPVFVQVAPKLPNRKSCTETEGLSLSRNIRDKKPQSTTTTSNTVKGRLNQHLHERAAYLSLCQRSSGTEIAAQTEKGFRCLETLSDKKPQSTTTTSSTVKGRPNQHLHEMMPGCTGSTPAYLLWYQCQLSPTEFKEEVLLIITSRNGMKRNSREKT
mmetsp:Transcript_38670/g.152698  ORF Transcript_38670/g.152698 Transcript_38670/m.152698 type:complete len:173 (-) Transcript_38670:46-564(-)